MSLGLQRDLPKHADLPRSLSCWILHSATLKGKILGVLGLQDPPSRAPCPYPRARPLLVTRAHRPPACPSHFCALLQPAPVQFLYLFPTLTPLLWESDPFLLLLLRHHLHRPANTDETHLITCIFPLDCNGLRIGSVVSLNLGGHPKSVAWHMVRVTNE